MRGGIKMFPGTLIDLFLPWCGFSATASLITGIAARAAALLISNCEALARGCFLPGRSVPIPAFDPGDALFEGEEPAFHADAFWEEKVDVASGFVGVIAVSASLLEEEEVEGTLMSREGRGTDLDGAEATGAAKLLCEEPCAEEEGSRCVSSPSPTTTWFGSGDKR